MKFCFWGDINGALAGETTGGAELQIALLAKALREQGDEVVIINFLSGESITTDDGIKIINVPNWNKGIRVFRLFFNRVPALWKIFADQHADYYYVRSRSFLHIIPFFVSRLQKSKFIVALAHDLDVMKTSYRIKHEYRTKSGLFQTLTFYLLNDLVFDYVKKRADYVLLQHEGQRTGCKSIRGKAILYPNIIKPPDSVVKNMNSGKYFVHVGSLTVLKGALNLKKLVAQLSDDISLIIIGEPQDQTSRAIVEELSVRSNLLFTGRLDHGKTIEAISNSIALINTSNYEGFPNVFLEAWSNGVPVISLLVNPGNVINMHNLGIFCNGDIKVMKESMESFNALNHRPDDFRRYISNYHSFENSAIRLKKVLNNQ